MSRKPAIAFALIALNGCAPIPNYWYKAPAISGVVTSNGEPVEGVAVHAITGGSAPVNSGTTDSAGHFTIEPVRDFRWFKILTLGDAPGGYSLELIRGGQSFNGYTTRYWGEAPTRITVACDLGRPVVGADDPTYCEAKGAK